MSRNSTKMTTNYTNSILIMKIPMIFWDENGKKFGLGKGLTIFADDIKKLNTSTNKKIKVLI